MRQTVFILAMVLAGALAGCSAKPDMDLRHMVDRGEYGQARAHLLRRGLESEQFGNRDYLLDRARLSVVTLADGLPDRAEEVTNRLYELLRTQGINEDRTVSAVVINEDLKFWKGEPFEQAMMYHYVAIQKGLRGEWGNMRAAAGSSLFLLKDFSRAVGREHLSSADLAAHAARLEDGDDLLDHGYVPVSTDFALGYLMSAIANLHLGRDEEASDQLREAARLEPALDGVAGALRAGEYNAVLVVDAGRGPEKILSGPDGAVARFVARTRSDRRRLSVRADGRFIGAFPVVCDVNRMAADHRWNNLEDVRIAKSTLGSVLLTTGAVMATSRDEAVRWTGLGLMLVGAFSKLGAHADTRYLEVLPQRVYVAPVTLPSDRASMVELAIDGGRGERLVLHGVRGAGAGDRPNLYYARIPGTAQAWARSAEVLYGNDAYDGDVPGDGLPFILGGRCARAPTYEALERYQRAGYLRGMTLSELRELYSLEGIRLDEAPGEVPGRHVLEGGPSLASPMPGSTGFTRVFGRPHADFEARSREVAELRQRIRQEGAGARQSVPAQARTGGFESWAE